MHPYTVMDKFNEEIIILIHMHPGPPYCPVENIPSPYDESYLPAQQSDHTTKTFYKSDKKPSISNGKSLHNSTTAPPTFNEDQYPGTLPKVGDYELIVNDY